MGADRDDDATLALFGASGRTGRRVLREALQAGLGVRALVRRPGSLDLSLARLHRVVGHPTEPADVERTLEGATAAVLLYGPHPPYRDRFCADAARTIVGAMADAGPSRLVAVTGGIVGADVPTRPWPLRAMRLYARLRHPRTLADVDAEEAIIAGSDLDWTLVKPARLTNADDVTEPRAGPRERLGLLSRVPRRALARLLVQLATGHRYVRERIYVRT